MNWKRTTPDQRCEVLSDSQRPNPPQQAEHLVDRWREVDSRDLMQGDREIVIRHGTEAYRLSVTRSGKLILRK